MIVTAAGHMEVQIVVVTMGAIVGVNAVLLVQLLVQRLVLHQFQVVLLLSIAQIQQLISRRKLRVVLKAMLSGLTMAGKSLVSVVSARRRLLISPVAVPSGILI
jgi:hypothetical protein